MTQEPGPTPADAEVSRTRRSGRLLMAAIVVVVVIIVIVALVILGSLRTAPVAVPNVVGETTATAAATLRGAHLSLGAVEVTANASVTNLQITRQRPAASAKAAKGSSVDVLVNIQPHNVAMPSFVGLTRDAAEAQLLSYPFTPVFMEQFSDTVPADQVVSQAPAAGQPWATSQPVVVEVSLGKGTSGVHVPDLTGMSAAQAQLAVDSAGLKVQLFTISNAGIPAGNFITQLPAPGTLVRSGSPVAVFVAGATP